MSSRLALSAAVALIGCGEPPQNLPIYWTGAPADAGRSPPGNVATTTDEPVAPETGEPMAAGTRDAGAASELDGPRTVLDAVRAGTDAGPAVACAQLAVTGSFTGTGQYHPRNVGAIWIVDGAGKFVKTLAVWAGQRAGSLVHWSADSAPAGSARRVDAISGATASGEGTHTGRWDCTDYRKTPVADGAYRVCFEIAESNGGGIVQCVPFNKTSVPLKLSPADSPNFKARAIDFSP
jgi:hypothetical protein